MGRLDTSEWRVSGYAFRRSLKMIYVANTALKIASQCSFTLDKRGSFGNFALSWLSRLRFSEACERPFIIEK